ncbi:MAG: CDP-diacylglycerol--glycerol-3-phosphate 3-phosphatidyltransferase [Spirochaetes bacterium]|nr:MAG: CDP-diacylglycerol--glycerol-3-phosphate 3-phosphatidyltransferase [Spirochaetota bacterium]
MSRLFLAPVFFFLYIYPILPTLATMILLWILFAAIEISDLVDGRVARSSNEVSSFGKLFDPFADVLARITYFVCFAAEGIMPLWILLIILYREFSIQFLRNLLSLKSIAMGARPGGKLKAGLYMVSGLLSLAYVSVTRMQLGLSFLPALHILVQVSYGLAVLLSVVSFLDYLNQYNKLTAK